VAVDEIITLIGSKIRLSPSTKFLANYLAKNYLYNEKLKK
jgi:Cyclin, N-terminal domain